MSEGKKRVSDSYSMVSIHLNQSTEDLVPAQQQQQSSSTLRTTTNAYVDEMTPDVEDNNSDDATTIDELDNITEKKYLKQKEYSGASTDTTNAVIGGVRRFNYLKRVKNIFNVREISTNDSQQDSISVASEPVVANGRNNLSSESSIRSIKTSVTSLPSQQHDQQRQLRLNQLLKRSDSSSSIASVSTISSYVRKPAAQLRTVLSRFHSHNNNNRLYYIHMASECNNVAADLYQRQQYVPSMELCKEAIKAIKMALELRNSPEWDSLPLLDNADCKAVFHKITKSKDFIKHYDIYINNTGKALKKNETSTLNSRLGIFHWPKSVQGQGCCPKYILDPLYVPQQLQNSNISQINSNQQEQSSTTNNNTITKEQHYRHCYIGSIVLFNLSLIYIQRHDTSTALKYSTMALNLVPQDYAEHFHLESIAFACLHNNIGCIHYLQQFQHNTTGSFTLHTTPSTSDMLHSLSLQEFQLAFNLSRFHRSYIRELLEDDMDDFNPEKHNIHFASILHSARNVTSTNDSNPFMKQLEQCMKQINSIMGIISTNIAHEYFFAELDEECMDFLMDALSSFTNAVTSNEYDVDGACTNYNIGIIYHRQDHYEKAMHYYSNFLYTIGHVSNLPSQDIITGLCNALLCSNVHQSSQAQMNTLLRNIQTLRCDFGYDHPSLPNLLRDLGNILQENNEYDYAMHVFNEVLRVDEALKGIIEKSSSANSVACSTTDGNASTVSS